MLYDGWWLMWLLWLLCFSYHIEELIRLSNRCRTIASSVQTARPSIRSCRSVLIGRMSTVTRPPPIMTTIISTIFIAAVMRAKMPTKRRRPHSIYNEPKLVSNEIKWIISKYQLCVIYLHYTINLWKLIAGDVRRSKENRGDQKSRPRHNYAQSSSNLNVDTTKRPITSYYTPTTSSTTAKPKTTTTTTTTAATERNYYNNNHNGNHNNYNSNNSNNDDSKRKSSPQQTQNISKFITQINHATVGQESALTTS